MQQSLSSKAWKAIDVKFFDTPQDTLVQTYHIRPSDGPTYVQGNDIFYPLTDSSTPILAKLLVDLIYPFTEEHDHRHVSVQYAPRYRLAFSLLNEDAADGDHIIDWDIQGALAKYFSPFLKSVSSLHNFTIESQVQYHAPLSVQARTQEDGSFALSQEDLAVFINSAEWSLSSSVSNDPVLHFILFVPSRDHRPLRILDLDGKPSSSSSFILPQWGGVVMFNPPETQVLRVDDLLSPSAAFLGQLHSLLGVPRSPALVNHQPREAGLSSWQLDTMLRKRSIENIRDSQDTLRSIVRLVNQIENMPVGEKVRGAVDASLAALRQLQSVRSTKDIFRRSADAVHSASSAFFSPDMLAMLYFPAEHKYAVYTPLFASGLIPVLGAVVREIKAWKDERKLARAKVA